MVAAAGKGLITEIQGGEMITIRTENHQQTGSQASEVRKENYHYQDGESSEDRGLGKLGRDIITIRTENHQGTGDQASQAGNRNQVKLTMEQEQL